MTRFTLKSLALGAAMTASLVYGGAALAGAPEDNIKVVQGFFAAYGAVYTISVECEDLTQAEARFLFDQTV